MSFNFVNNIHMLWAHLLYVTLFSSNIYVFVIYSFYVTQFAKKMYMFLWSLKYVVQHIPQNSRAYFVCSTSGPIQAF